MKTIFLSLMIITLCSCHGNNNRITDEIKKLHGQTIDFVSGFDFAVKDHIYSDEDLFSQEYKVVSYVDYFTCTKCLIDNFKQNASEVKANMGDSIPYILIIYTDNIQSTKEIIKEYKIGANVLLYDSKKFESKNNLNVMARNKTFLLDKKNRILVVGEPFGNKEKWNVYKKAKNIHEN